MPPAGETMSPEAEADRRAYEAIQENRGLIERMAGYGLPVSHRYQRLLDFAAEFEEEHDV